MADIISRLKLESGEFDSKIKRAGQELMAYSEHCRKTGLEMGYANRDAKEFAKALGNMQTTSSTARGKISELSDAFVNLRVMYKNMTDEEKNNQFGKNLAASLDKLKTRINEAKKDLADVTTELNGKKGGGLFGGGKLDGMLQVFGGNLMTKGAGMLAGLASEMGDMVKQGVELAKQGEGIRIAFERLGRGDILDGLRQATHGTVTDIELMKAAVKFNDFKLPLDELGTMLAFAQQKAKDTGQSVDYMVDSIVTGLGRKSLMILDNLGLSATEIKDKMAETGDMTKAVGAIIREQMAKAGDYVETAADRAAQANVSLQNKMEELGRKFAPLQEASDNLWTSMKIKILDVVGGPLAQLLNGLTEAGRIRNQMQNMGGSESVNKQLGVLRLAKSRGATGYMSSRYQMDVADYQKQINDIDFKIAAYHGGRDSIERGQIERLKEQKAAVQALFAEYKKGAHDIMSASEATNAVVAATTGGTTKGGTGTSRRTADDIIREQGLAMQRHLYAGVDGIGPATDTGASAIWRALVEREDRRISDRRGTQDALEALNKAEGISPSGREREKSREDRNMLATSKDLLNGVSQLTDGLEKIGIDIPDEIQSVIGVIQGVMQVIDAVNTIIGVTQTTALTANTIAMTSLTAALWANTATSWIPFANGGVVHAAGGIVAGNTYSGDQIPAMLNAGEVVLNRAQTGNLASQLQGSGFGNARLVGRLKGRDILISIDRELSATGKGQLATWK